MCEECEFPIVTNKGLCSVTVTEYCRLYKQAEFKGLHIL